MSEQTNTDLAIEVRGLVKRYNEEVLAVDGVDLTIPTNTIYAMLGPNGAGKTTTISVLTTLLQPTDGSAKVLGLDVVAEGVETAEQDAQLRAIGCSFAQGWLYGRPAPLTDVVALLDRRSERTPALRG